ncbi:MAG: bifunctional glutamate N-acetyltransferase/amino-acid acetyltransferase ArgJ [Planctomycetaceae bacterium]
MTVEHELPAGFRVAGLHCGIKDGADKFDLALFVSDTPCTAAGTFTRNRVVGAPVKVSRERVPNAKTRAVVVNSGNANACTGERGLEDARWMTERVAGLIGCEAQSVLVCSTGVIGRFLPREKLDAGFPAAVGRLAHSPAAFHDAARGMMTTDTFPKQCVREVAVGGRPVRVSGAAKGAAMIAPNMATMLAVVMTDAGLDPSDADRMLRHAVGDSFNCISVEGHTSTSDSVILLANGASGVAPTEPSDLLLLEEAIDAVCRDLAIQIIRDAEGAGHFITIDVRGVRNRDEARRIAKTVAESPLVKTAVAGADPNWGRIVSAAGYSGVDLREEDVSLSINGTRIYEAGRPVEHDATALSQQMRDKHDVHIELDLTLGDESVRFWTCDLTAEYVRLNAEYTT